MNTKLLLAGWLVLCIVTVSGQGYNPKTIQNDTKSLQELQSDGFIKVNTDGRLQGTDKESFPEAVLKSAVVKQRLDSMIYNDPNMTLKYEYSYGDNELQNECNEYMWKNNLWKPYMKWKYFYNESGKMSKQIKSWYGGSNGVWVDEMSYFYDADGKVTESINDTGGKLEFTYDSKGNLTVLTFQNYREENLKEIFIYDATGNLAEVTAFTMSGAIDWQNKFIYDPDNKITQVNIFDSLAGRDTVFYSYDLNDNLIVKTVFWWNNNVREVWLKEEYTYDNSYSFSDLILPVNVGGYLLYPGETSDNIYFNHKLLNYKTIEAGGWQSSAKYYYSDFPSQKGISSSIEIKMDVVNFYPNPVTDKLYFNFRENHSRVIFQLFDIGGAKVMEREISDNQYLKMDDLTTGMYLYNVVTKKSRQSGRLIKY
jgi:YD repeat-containing protein